MSGYLHFYAQHPAIALIAEKLNESGNAFHNTADWQDETDYLGGKSACDIVQEALNAADEAFNTLAAAEGGEGTPETDACADWNARCERVGDNEIITHGLMLALAHDEGDELRLLARRLERERNALAARVRELEDRAASLQVVGWLRGYQFISLPEDARPEDVPVYTAARSK